MKSKLSIFTWGLIYVDEKYLNGKGGGGRLIWWKKGIFLKNFFGNTDSVISFSQFSYNNATFEQYLPKFSLQNIENWASASLKAPQKKSCFAVYIITRNRIIWNKKIKVHLLTKMFLEVTLRRFFFRFFNFS